MNGHDFCFICGVITNVKARTAKRKRVSLDGTDVKDCRLKIQQLFEYYDLPCAAKLNIQIAGNCSYINFLIFFKIIKTN